jgi:hypothetical protein
VSNHQGWIDWATVAQQPKVRFAFLKATVAPAADLSSGR